MPLPLVATRPEPFQPAVLRLSPCAAAPLQGFLVEGLQRTSAGLGSVIIDSQPLTVALLASLLFGERLGAAGVAGLFIGVAGLCLLEVPPNALDGLLAGGSLAALLPSSGGAAAELAAVAAGSSGAAAEAAAAAVASSSGSDGSWTIWDSG